MVGWQLEVLQQPQRAAATAAAAAAAAAVTGATDGGLGDRAQQIWRAQRHAAAQPAAHQRGRGPRSEPGGQLVAAAKPLSHGQAG